MCGPRSMTRICARRRSTSCARSHSKPRQRNKKGRGTVKNSYLTATCLQNRRAGAESGRALPARGRRALPPAARRLPTARRGGRAGHQRHSSRSTGQRQAVNSSPQTGLAISARVGPGSRSGTSADTAIAAATPGLVQMRRRKSPKILPGRGADNPRVPEDKVIGEPLRNHGNPRGSFRATPHIE